jgi:hypothetical protein
MFTYTLIYSLYANVYSPPIDLHSRRRVRFCYRVAVLMCCHVPALCLQWTLNLCPVGSGRVGAERRVLCGLWRGVAATAGRCFGPRRRVATDSSLGYLILSNLHFIEPGNPQWLLYAWLRYYATSRKVADSIPNEVIGIFNWRNPSSRIMILGSIQPLTEMSTRNLPGGKERPAGA